MTSQFNIITAEYPSLRSASKRIFKMICDRLDVKTAYVAKRGRDAMTVLSSLNLEEEIIPEEYSVEYGGTYCRLILGSQDGQMTTKNLLTFESTKDLEVTPELNAKGFLGVTLKNLQGDIFGTLCVMDKDEKVFNQEEIDYLKGMAEVLAHTIELDQTTYNMTFLSVPIIPITSGVAVLSIQGIIDEGRAETILTSVLHYGTTHQIDHFIIDLSGLHIIDGIFPHVLINLVKSLELMGTQTIVTGITPEIAKYDLQNGQELIHLDTHVVRNLESALEHIGFHLTEI
ncbi:STAS domain-containing protein [Jeotgalibacillus proteolyticus]|uniref:Anti-anti-sigma factor n=1 Tax=Jeotgalibacillus proteolyticus TaxID=2082395 RepID=A0A2S5G8Q7_9BACL|nr:STAS domain-containing protein [Jeotgalibacillus proteolyticus]PPA69313.1 anti-anti-sigma factor [Jeotgalibacillus proteolyticus]